MRVRASWDVPVPAVGAEKSSSTKLEGLFMAYTTKHICLLSSGNSRSHGSRSRRRWALYSSPRLLLALLLVGILAGGCDSAMLNPDTAVRDASPTSLGASKAGPQPTEGEEAEFETPPSLDLFFFHVAEQVPGFGGFFFDEEGHLATYLIPEGELEERGYEGLSDEERTERLRVLIEAYFEDEDFYARGGDERVGTDGGEAIRILPAEFDATQLLSWRWQLREAATESVVSIDFDESQNRVVLGVQDNEEEILALLEELEIPESAVEVIQEEPVEPSATLTSAIRGLQGGTQISFDTNPDDNLTNSCTLGFPAALGSTWGFVTNAHCSKTMGSTTAKTRYQQGSSSDVAEEAVDPAFFRRRTVTYKIKSCTLFGWWCKESTGTRTYNANCPSGANCRYSDALFAKSTRAAELERGRIARVTGNGTTGARNSGSKTIDPNKPTYRIVRTAQYAISGQWLDKVGRTTGHTYGKVDRTDYDVWQGKSGNFMLDQQRVGNVYENGGDSGSPVFDWSYSGDITLYGVLWGGDHSSHFVYSPLRGLNKDGLNVAVR